MHSINTFISQSFKHFIKTGSVLPSSRRLAKRITKNIKGSVIIELGPGTGVFTKEILKVLPYDGLLISIESNKVFVKYLENHIKDKRLILHNGDALKLREFLKKNNIKKVSCIVSGLPIGNFKKEAKEKLLKEISECLEDDGVYIQFEYFLAGIKAVKKFFPHISLSFELFNFPPAFVMRCKKSKR
ncbi:MAG: L-histidine N(alpha)-methyltransferase [Patescibacteria group bacterium]